MVTTERYDVSLGIHRDTEIYRDTVNHRDLKNYRDENERDMELKIE